MSEVEMIAFGLLDVEIDIHRLRVPDQCELRVSDLDLDASDHLATVAKSRQAEALPVPCANVPWNAVTGPAPSAGHRDLVGTNRCSQFERARGRHQSPLRPARSRSATARPIGRSGRPTRMRPVRLPAQPANRPRPRATDRHRDARRESPPFVTRIPAVQRIGAQSTRRQARATAASAPRVSPPSRSGSGDATPVPAMSEHNCQALEREQLRAPHEPADRPPPDVVLKWASPFTFRGDC